MKPVAEIILKKHFNATTLNTRDEADALFSFLRTLDTQKVIIDFSDIDFISRSFAHQFHMHQTNWEKEAKTLFELRNPSELTQQMFQAVSNTYTKSLSDSVKIPVLQFNDIRYLYKYLASI